GQGGGGPHALARHGRRRNLGPAWEEPFPHAQGLWAPTGRGAGKRMGVLRLSTAPRLRPALRRRASLLGPGASFLGPFFPLPAVLRPLRPRDQPMPPCW